MSGLVLWIAVGIIGAGVALIIAAPLLRAGQRMSRGAGAMYDLAVFRDQLAEVDRDLDSGLLSETEATAARTEIERRMLRAVDGHSDALTGDALTGDEENEAAPARFAAAAFPLALGMLVAVAAVALYLNTGAPDQQDAPFAMRTDITPTARAPGQAGGDSADGSKMRAQLRQRLDANPNDMAGWVMLARTERALGDHQNSVQAFARAIELAGAKASADLVADYGEALVFESFGTVSPRATEVFERVLALDPREIKSRFYIAAGRAQAGDYKGAIALWRGLTADAPPDAPWIKEVRARISDAAMKGGIMPMSVAPERPSAIAGAGSSGLGGAIAGSAGPSAEDVKSAQAMAPEDRTAFIKSMVQRLADRMKENPDDVDGWLRLGRAYTVLGEGPNSKAAFGQAKRRLTELLANIPTDSPNRSSLQATLTEVEGLIAE